ncbi:MAG: hypothetical protein AAFN30_12055 [Actinomycetota bacterium]
MSQSDPSLAPPPGGAPLNSGGLQYSPPTASSPAPAAPQAFSSGDSGGGPAPGAPAPQAFSSGGGPAPAATPVTRPVVGPPGSGPPTGTAGGPQGYPGQQPPAAGNRPPSSGGMSKGLLVALGFVGALVVLFVALVAIGLAVGDGDDGDDDGDVAQNTSVTTADSGSSTENSDPSTEFTLPITPVPDVAPQVIVDSPFTPTPCPAGVERAACLLAVAMDGETGEMIAAYEVFGFTPELEPIDYHLHFYLDSTVAGDERKAGTEVPGGSWRAWDGILPFTSTGGENGRIGFNQDDVVAAGARHLCVIVADPEQQAVPGTGNCAPIPYVWDDNVALEQVDRLQGVYAGRCAIGATVIMPDGWQWLDFEANTPEDAARILRPGNVEEVTPIYQEFVNSGGIMLGDGPLDGDYIVNFTVWRVEGSFTAADTPAEVEDELSRAGLRFDNPPVTRLLGGRAINTQVLQGDGFEFTQYVVPDFGYALVLDFFSPDAAAWNDTSDAVAATLMGC